MAEQSKIEWTDHTFNPWEGCQKVAPECDNCYAEARDVRFTGGTHWGPNPWVDVTKFDVLHQNVQEVAA